MLSFSSTPHPVPPHSPSLHVHFSLFPEPPQPVLSRLYQHVTKSLLCGSRLAAPACLEEVGGGEKQGPSLTLSYSDS